MRTRLFATLALVVVACDSGAVVTPDMTPSQLPATPESVSTDAPLPTLPQSGPCLHLLWPLTDGAVWRYQLSRPDGTMQDVILTARVAGDQADLTLEFADGPVVSPFACTPEGLLGTLAGLTGHPDLGTALLLSNPDGPYMPSLDRLLPFGTQSSWDAQYQAGGTVRLPLAGGTIMANVTGGDAVLVGTTHPLEVLSVAAGSFDALPVEQSALFNLQVVGEEGSSGLVFGDARARFYWSEGVGLVRAEFEGGMMSSTLAAAPITLQSGVTLTLIDYQVPRQ